MKNVLKLVCLISLLFPLQQSFAQGTSNHYIRMLAQSDGNRVMLRWALSDYDTWKEGIQAGYKLERYTTHVNGVLNDGLAAYNSRVLLSDNLKPIAESQWSVQFPGNNFGELAKGTLYEEDVTIELNNDPTLADALNSTESEESRFLFALFAAEQDFQVAQAMALAFEDQSIEAGKTYMYVLTIKSTDPEFEGLSGGVNVNADDLANLPVVTGLRGEGMDQAAIIEWNIEATQDHYTSFDIERSTDRVNFTKVNDLPFIFGADAKNDPGYAAYRDSFENNNISYFYRVRGRTPFGLQGPPSDMIEIMGVPPRINLFLKIDTFKLDREQAILIWESFDNDMESEIKGFNIYRSLESNAHFKKINDNVIDAFNRNYTDKDPLPTAYYQLEAIDRNGHSYLSPSELVQLPDSTPPAIPSGFTGEFITPTRVELTWDANTEDDLAGYRIVVANRKESQYTQITTGAVTGESFVYEIDPEFIAENIYFKIFSTDHHDNYSDKSAPIEIERPDQIAPAKPNLYKASPTPEGIQIGFRFSNSPDVTYHLLQRKAVGTPDWKEVLRIPRDEEDRYGENLTQGDITSTCYIDETILERREYEYRFLAYDDHDNGASSDVVTIRPYDNGKRGTIDDVRAIAECVPIEGADLPNKEAFELVDFLILYYKETGKIEYGALEKLTFLNIITNAEYNELIQLEPFEVNVFLSRKKTEIWGANIVAKTFIKWDYSTKDQLVDFQIFRSAEGSAMMLYKTLPIEELNDWIFEDEDVRPGRRYFYQVMARHAGGGYSERSETVMVKVPKS